jgi:hypothetical protein
MTYFIASFDTRFCNLLLFKYEKESYNKIVEVDLQIFLILQFPTHTHSLYLTLPPSLTLTHSLSLFHTNDNQIKLRTQYDVVLAAE